MAEHLEIRFPEDQQEGTEAVVSSWLKAPGEAVAAHEPVVEIETDKVVVEIAAPADGIIGEIRVNEGDPANPGDVLCTLITSSAESKVSEQGGAGSEVPSTAPAPPPSPRSAPRVRAGRSSSRSHSRHRAPAGRDRAVRDARAAIG